MSESYSHDNRESTADSHIPLIEDENDERLYDLAPRKATAALFRQLAGREFSGQFKYKLPRSSREAGYDVTARVKLPSFADRAMIDELPKELRKRAAELMFSNSTTPGRVDPIANMDRTTKRGREVANLYAVVGFQEPKVYFTRDEAERNDGVYVEDIPFEDRWTFVRMSDGEDTMTARFLSPFTGE